MLFVGIDWAEDHHDVCVLDVEGQVLARGRVPDGIEGLADAFPTQTVGGSVSIPVDQTSGSFATATATVP